MSKQSERRKIASTGLLGDCADCGMRLKEKAITRCTHTIVGQYYDGPPICEACAERRREQSWAQHFDTPNQEVTP